MQLQVALDRVSLDDVIRLATSVQQYADWIEVGTSLIPAFPPLKNRENRY